MYKYINSLKTIIFAITLHLHLFTFMTIIFTLMLIIYTTNCIYIYIYIKICLSIYNLLPRYLQFYTSHSKCRFFIPTGFYRVNI